MDWVSSIQRAIDYIDDHLDNKIDYAEVAKYAYSSTFHFQRVFAILCGMTLGEYIRCRRLARAVGDLLAGEKVIDVAIKYGYESSESFSRAFTRFHGVPLTQACLCRFSDGALTRPNFGICRYQKAYSRRMVADERLSACGSARSN